MFRLLRLMAVIFISTAYCTLAHAQKKGPVHPININTATRTELIQIPNVGEKMADRIVAFRKANGPFKRIEEIMNVRGMGEKTFLSIKRHLTVDDRHTKKNNPNTFK